MQRKRKNYEYRDSILDGMRGHDTLDKRGDKKMRKLIEKEKMQDPEYKSLLYASGPQEGSESSDISRYKAFKSAPAVRIHRKEMKKKDKAWSSATSYNNDVPRLPPVNWKIGQPESFVNIPYNMHELTISRSESTIAKYCEDFAITTGGKRIPPPILTFPETHFPDYIQAALKNERFDKPTPIQSMIWPSVMMGRDVIGVAPTGSGKTLAYIIPAILHIRSQPRRQRDEGPIAVILAPTRELALQIYQVANQYGADAKIRCCCLYGGVDKRAQAHALAEGVELCVATLGRLVDLLRTEQLNFHRTTYFVLDEAERMLAADFKENMFEIMEQVRPDRQTLLFSATWSEDSSAVADNLVTDCVFVTCGSLVTSANDQITQIVDCCSKKERWPKLLKLLASIIKAKDKRTLIFTKRRSTAEELSNELLDLGWPAAVMHKDKSQSDREFVLKLFRSGKVPFLVATGVAGRGLDIKEIGFVINFDMADTMEDYVHRIGRTGRAGHSGVAYTFFTEAGKTTLAEQLVSVLRRAHQQINPQLIRIAGGGVVQVLKSSSEASG